jgi:hypothetical protein
VAGLPPPPPPSTPQLPTQEPSPTPTRQIARLSCPSQLVASPKPGPSRSPRLQCRKAGWESSRFRFYLRDPAIDRSSLPPAFALSPVSPPKRVDGTISATYLCSRVPNPVTGPLPRQSREVRRAPCSVSSCPHTTARISRRTTSRHAALVGARVKSALLHTYKYIRRFSLHIRDRGLGVRPQQPCARLHSRRPLYRIHPLQCRDIASQTPEPGTFEVVSELSRKPHIYSKPLDVVPIHPPATPIRPPSATSWRPARSLSASTSCFE